MPNARRRAERPVERLRAQRVARERTLRTLAGDERGAVYVEYVTLLVLVSIGMAVATLSLGLPLWKLYKYAQMILAAPFP